MPSIWDAAKQYLRDASPGGALNPEVSRQGLLDTAALSTAPVPLLGDALGLLADANRYATDPSSRTPGNFALSGLGLLPFVPGMTSVKKVADNVPMPKPKPEPIYGMEHRPMADAGGAARLHDLTASFPSDIYGPNALHYYGSGDPREASVLRILKSLRGKPDAEVTIYRGIPDGAPGKINSGDWVTLDPRVAKEYGGQVVEMKVKAADITSWPDSLLEFGYFPKGK